jgi:hypothetical protein
MRARPAWVEVPLYFIERLRGDSLLRFLVELGPPSADQWKQVLASQAYLAAAAPPAVPQVPFSHSHRFMSRPRQVRTVEQRWKTRYLHSSTRSHVRCRPGRMRASW